MTYLLNLHTRKIHDANSTDGRCKLKLIIPNNKMTFSNYNEALEYLPDGKKSTRPCPFCLGNNYNQ